MKRPQGDAVAAEFAPDGPFCLRTPLLPFDTLVGAAAHEGGAQGQGELTDDAGVEAARARSRAWLARLVARPEVREALFVASPSIDGAIEGWAAGVAAQGGGATKLERALLRYAARMCSRPTPFGLFAAVSMGEAAATTALRLSPLSEARKHARLDVRVIQQLVVGLLAVPARRAALRYVTNPSVYESNGRLRFSRVRLDAGSRDGVEAADVGLRAPVRAAMAAAARGARYDAIVVAVREATRASEHAARGFVERLIDEQVLLAMVQPPITGPEPWPLLLDELSGSPELEPVREQMRVAIEAIDEIARGPVGVAPARYRAVSERLASGALPLRAPSSVQVDLFRPVDEASLGPAPLAEMARFAALALRLVGPKGGQLGAFVERFEARYEGAMIPLCEALDAETGVGLPDGMRPLDEPLLRDLPMTPREAARASQLLDGVRAALLARAAREGGLEVELLESDLPEPAPGRSLGDAFSVAATLCARAPDAIDRGEFMLITPMLMAPTSMSLLARFCFVDPSIDREVRRLIEIERSLVGDAVLADIAFQGADSLGNVMQRPTLMPAEIVCEGRSGAPVDRQIALSDLWVGVRGGEVVLWSRSMNKRVVPRCANAVNADFTSSMLFRFLAAVANQGLVGGRWGWGAFESVSFLPRVRSGATVLSPAQWRLSADEVRELTSDAAGAFVRVQRLRAALRWPRWVCLVQFDNVLPVDLDNPLLVDVFVGEMAGQTSVVVTEFLAAEAGRPVTGADGSFCAEVIVPFHRRAGAATGRAKAIAPKLARPSIARAMLPGEGVLYAKLYGGEALADRALVELLAPLARQAIGEGAASSWFFLRYADPNPHLRWRLFGGERLLPEVLPRLVAAVAAWRERYPAARLQFDTYTREVERYGGEAVMLLAEQIFHADSECCVELLNLLAAHDAPGDDARWRALLLSCHGLLRDLAPELDERLALVAAAEASMLGEFSTGAALSRAFDARAREHRPWLAAIAHDVSSDATTDAWLASVEAAVTSRSSAVAPLAAQLRAAAAADDLASPLRSVVGSFVHMSVNRMCERASREQELVIYALLARAYESRIARERRTAAGGRRAS